MGPYSIYDDDDYYGYERELQDRLRMERASEASRRRAAVLASASKSRNLDTKKIEEAAAKVFQPSATTPPKAEPEPVPKEKEVASSLSEVEVKFISQLAFFLGQISDTKKTDTDDVEAWAFQDGWNGAIGKMMEHLEKLKDES